VQFGGCRQTIAPHGAPAAGSFRDLDASVSLSFNGECEAAFKLYERLLGAKAEFVITWGGSPLGG
jgi:hypothetical protein